MKHISFKLWNSGKFVHFFRWPRPLNFSRTAEIVHLSQPALSLQIQALEDEIGAKLFERDRRKTVLTSVGTAFQKEATGGLAQLEQAVQSARLGAGRPEYESTVGATVQFQRNYNGKQPGDPAKAAAALLHIASLPDPPLRLLLGSDSYAAAEKSALDKLESDRQWKDLSLSTDYSS